MTNEAGIIICLPFSGSRAGRVQDVSGWSLVLPRAGSGVVWCAAGGALQNQGSLGGDGLMTRAGNRDRLLLHNVDRVDRVFLGGGLAAGMLVMREAWRARFLGSSCWRWMLTASWCRIAGL